MVQKFIRRSGLSLRRVTSIGQLLPNNHEEKIKNFRKFFMEGTLDSSPNNIGSVGEVPVPFEIVNLFVMLNIYYRSLSLHHEILYKNM